MAGYSGTPLIKKLGIKEGFRVAFVNAPKDFRKDLGTIAAECPHTPPISQTDGFCIAVYEIGSGIRKRLCKNRRTALTQWHVMGRLAQESVWRCH